MDSILKYKYIIIGFIAFILYANTLSHDFVWDDQLVITQNSLTQKGVSGLKEIWTERGYIAQRPVYRPIPQSIFALEHELFPNNTFFAHTVQVISYAICCMIFLLCLNELFLNTKKWLLIFISLLFVLLPSHSEVVANIKSLDEVLSLTFGLLAIYFSLKSKKSAIAFSFIFLILALLSKISFITLFWVPLYILLKYNEVSRITIFSFLKTYWQNILLFLSLVVSGLITYSTDYDGLAALIGIIVGLSTVYLHRSLFTFGLFILSLFIISIHTSFLCPLIIIIIWLFQQDKITSVKDYKPIVFILASAVYFTMDSPYFWVFLIVAFIINLIKINAKKWRRLLIIPIILFCFTLILNYLNSHYNFLGMLLILSPLFFYYKHHFSKKPIVAFLFLSLVFFSLFDAIEDDAFYFLSQLKREVVEENSTSANQDKLIIKNTPYHNILVSVEDPTIKAATICRIQLVYLQKLIFPTALVHQHGTWQIQLASWKDWDVYLSILIHLLLLYLAYYFYKQKYYIAMWGILWYFITISIYTNIIRLMPDTLAERFLFLPSVGFSIAFVSGLYFFIQKYLKEERKSLIALALLLFPLMSYYAYKTVDRNKDWENNYTLAANTLPYAGNNAAINAQYALELNNLIKDSQIDNVDSAKQLVVKHYQKAIDIFPDFYGPNADLASYYILEAQPDKAFPYLLESTRINPKEWIHHYYLGLIYYERNNYAEGIKQFNHLIENETLQSRALEFPELLEAYEFSARCLHNTGKDNEAYTLLNEAIEIFNQKSTYILLANLYRVTGKQDLAIETFNRLLVLTPNDQELINTIEYLKAGKIY